MTSNRPLVIDSIDYALGNGRRTDEAGDQDKDHLGQ